MNTRFMLSSAPVTVEASHHSSLPSPTALPCNSHQPAHTGSVGPLLELGVGVSPSSPDREHAGPLAAASFRLQLRQVHGTAHGAKVPWTDLAPLVRSQHVFSMIFTMILSRMKDLVSLALNDQNV